MSRVTSQPHCRSLVAVISALSQNLGSVSQSSLALIWIFWLITRMKKEGEGNKGKATRST